eukprot:33206-Rhodomonas_salina.1
MSSDSLSIGSRESLPDPFAAALLALRAHPAAFLTPLSKAGDYYRSLSPGAEGSSKELEGGKEEEEKKGEELVVPVSAAAEVSGAWVERLKLHPWAPTGSSRRQTSVCSRTQQRLAGGCSRTQDSDSR